MHHPHNTQTQAEANIGRGTQYCATSTAFGVKTMAAPADRGATGREGVGAMQWIPSHIYIIHSFYCICCAVGIIASCNIHTHECNSGRNMEKKNWLDIASFHAQRMYYPCIPGNRYYIYGTQWQKNVCICFGWHCWGVRGRACKRAHTFQPLSHYLHVWCSYKWISHYGMNAFARTKQKPESAVSEA